MPDAGTAIQSATLRRTMALAFLARNGGVVNNSARRDFTVTGANQYQFDGCRIVHVGKAGCAECARPGIGALWFHAVGRLRAASNPQSPWRRRVKGDVLSAARS